MLPGMSLLLALACSTSSETPATTPTSGPASASAASSGGSEAPAPAPTGLCDGTAPSTPAGPACLTGTIACGQTLTDSTSGGTMAGDAELYESAYCFPPHDDHTGPDRFYAFDLAAEQTAFVTLDSPCTDLSLVALSWPDRESCPVQRNHTIAVCEGKELIDEAELKLWTKNKRRFLIGVDGPAGTGAAFELGVRCE